MAEVPEVRVCTTREETEAAYAHAQSVGAVYVAVEQGNGTWGVVYDLLPANRSLEPAELESLRETVTQHVEERVGDSGPTEEVGHGIGAEMGSLYGFRRREDAERIAGVIAETIGPT